MSWAILPTLVAGRELELVATHVRAGDDAEQARLDPEVLERLEQRLGDDLAVADVRAAGLGLAALERLRVGGFGTRSPRMR